jgi:probable rRNA maturation factor
MTALTYTGTAGRPHQRYIAFLKSWLPKAVKLVKNSPAEISIALVGNTKMAALHQQFMNIPGPTDVLTFELDHDSRGRVTAGEIVICAPFARKAAKQRSVDLNHELLLYALHGVLHLSGYDDLTPKDFVRIHKEEDRILKEIGIGAVFNVSAK